MMEIYRLFEAMELLRRSVKKDMPSQHISLLLTVSQNPGISMPDLSRKLGMPQGTVSRNVKLLSRYAVHNSEGASVCGLDLLSTAQDLENSHARAVFLSEKGKMVIAELACTLNPGLRERLSSGEDGYAALLPLEAVG